MFNSANNAKNTEEVLLQLDSGNESDGSGGNTQLRISRYWKAPKVKIVKAVNLASANPVGYWKAPRVNMLKVRRQKPVRGGVRSFRSTLHALQEWEGYVIEIREKEFVARLIDITAGHSHESQEATIPLTEISEDDAACMEIGSIFRWVIGYESSSPRTKQRVSRIEFCDLPRMTASDFQEGRAWAEDVVRALNL